MAQLSLHPSTFFENVFILVYHVTESTTSTTSLVNQLLENCAKITIACSQTIFYACKNFFMGRSPPFQTSVYVVINVTVALSFYLYCISLLVSLGICIWSHLFIISLTPCHAHGVCVCCGRMFLSVHHAYVVSILYSLVIRNNNGIPPSLPTKMVSDAEEKEREKRLKMEKAKLERRLKEAEEVAAQAETAVAQVHTMPYSTVCGCMSAMKQLVHAVGG